MAKQDPHMPAYGSDREDHPVRITVDVPRSLRERIIREALKRGIPTISAMLRFQLNKDFPK